MSYATRPKELCNEAEESPEETRLVALFHELLEMREDKSDKCVLLFDKDDTAV